MRIKTFLAVILALSLAAVTSCIPGIKAKRQIYFISLSSDYRDHICSRGNAPVLNATNHDQYGLTRELLELDDSVDAKLFLSSYGNRYILSASLYGAAVPDSGTVTKTSLDILPHKEALWNSRDILSCLRETADKAGVNDLIIFQYSGHGAESSGDLILSVKDDRSEHIAADTISPSELLGSISSTEATVLLIMDSCYSGNFIKENVLADGIMFKEEEKAKTENFVLVSYFDAMGRAIGQITMGNTRKHPNVYVLSACTSKQTSWDSDISLYKPGTKENERFGGFTYYLLKSLGYDPLEDVPHKNSNRITLYGVYQDIWNSMPGYHKKSNSPLVTLSPLDIVLFNP